MHFLPLVALLIASIAVAQQPILAPASQPTPTLHVYANLVQIPVLVLSSTRDKLYTPIASDRFSLSFDNGPWVKAANAHLEGDDPIDLAIVVDARGAQKYVLPTLDQAIAKLAPAQLHSTDHVSIYVMACGRVRSAQNIPADPVDLKSAADTALADVTARRTGKDKSPCSDSAPLWDVLADAANGLSKSPGRRVVLAIANGSDNNSNRSWSSLISFAQDLGITIFALDPDLPSSDANLQSGMPRTITGTVHPADYLPDIAELTGGILLRLPGENAYDPLKRFVEMVRARYIIDFRRPTAATAGVHNLQVHIDGGSYFIRTAGDTIPAATPGQNDANTIQLTNAMPEPPTAVPPAAQPEPTQQAAAPQVTTTQPAPSPKIPTLKVTTRLAVVDVTAMGKNSQPVHSLQKPDFAVKEDGKPQPIKDFNEYGTQIASGQPSLPKLAPNVFTNQQPSRATTSAVNVILLDEVTTGLGLVQAPDNAIMAKRGALDYLKKLPPGTQVGILLLADGLHVIQPPTSDRDILIAALNAFQYKPVESTYTKGPGDHCDVGNMQNRLQLEALNQAAAYLSGISGRKNLIWFTPGTPWLTSYLAYSQFKCLINFTDKLNETYAALTDAQVALYPIDPRGVKATGATADTSQVFDSSGRVSPGSDLAGVAAQDDVNADRLSMGNMAEATGGAAYFNRNDLDGALADAISTGDDYYSLSYVPPVSKYDGKHHKIDVKVDKPGIQLQYRDGYTSVDPSNLSKELKPATKTDSTPENMFYAAMEHGAVTSTLLTFGIRVTPSSDPASPGNSPALGLLSPSLKDKPLVRYDVLCAMPSDQLTLVQDGPNGARTGALRFIVVAYDAEGNRLNALTRAATFSLKPDQVAKFLQSPFQMPLKLDLPPGAISLRAGVLDPASGKIGTLEVPITITKPPSK